MRDKENENALEEKLLPYVIEKLGFTEMTKTEKFFIGEQAMAERKKYFTIVVQSFIRCLVNAQEKMMILDIASASLAETYRIMEAAPKGNFQLKYLQPFKPSQISYHYTDFHFLMKEEMHEWMLYLQEEGLLPGKYEQYTGTFRPAV